MWRTRLTDSQIKDILKDLFSNFDYHSYWMILWIGKLYKNAEGNILIETAFVRIKEVELTKFDISKLDFGHLKVIGIPAHLVSIIVPGLLFKEGLVDLHIHYNYLRPEKIKISVDGIKSTTLGSWTHGDELRKKLGFHKNDLPFKAGEKKRFGERSNIYVIPNTNTDLPVDYLIYPSMEMARGYLFRSSIIAQGMIDPNSISKKDNIFYVPQSLKYPNQGNPFHFLTLRDEMYSSDAWLIARIAFSHETKLAVAEIQKEFLNGEPFSQTKPLYINTIFPFNGDAHQEVYGMTIDLGDIKVFLVFEISECYSLFPYTSLRYSKESKTPKVNNLLPEVPGVDEGNDQGGDEENKNPNYWYIYTPSFDKDATRNNAKKNDVNIKNAIYTDKKIRFPNLTKDIRRIVFERDVAPKEDHNRKTILPTSNLSQNQQKEKNTNSTALEVLSEEGKDVFLDGGNYIDLIKSIVKHFVAFGCRVRYHNGLDEHGQDDFHCIRINVEGLELDSQQRKFSEMSDNLQRRVVAVCAELKGKHFLLLEFEPRGQNAYKIFLKTNNHEAFSNDDVAMLIEHAIVTYGSMSNLSKNYKYFRFNHEKSSPRAHAKRILKGVDFL